MTNGISSVRVQDPIGVHKPGITRTGERNPSLVSDQTGRIGDIAVLPSDQHDLVKIKQDAGDPHPVLW